MYSLVSNYFYQKGSLFAYWSNIYTFLSEKDPIFNTSFTHTMTVFETKSFFLKK